MTAPPRLTLAEVETMLVLTFLEGYELGYVRDKPVEPNKLLEKALWNKDRILSPGTRLSIIPATTLNVDHGVAPPPMFILSLEWLLDTIEKNCRFSAKRRAEAAATMKKAEEMREAIERAPHELGCNFVRGFPRSPCDCWKAQALLDRLDAGK